MRAMRAAKNGGVERVVGGGRGAARRRRRRSARRWADVPRVVRPGLDEEREPVGLVDDGVDRLRRPVARRVSAAGSTTAAAACVGGQRPELGHGEHAARRRSRPWRRRRRGWAVRRARTTAAARPGRSGAPRRGCGGGRGGRAVGPRRWRSSRPSVVVGGGRGEIDDDVG